MKRFLSGLVLASSLLMMSSCCSQPEVDGKWNVLKVNGEDVVVTGDKTPFIEFNAEESKVHGYTGCNIMNGAYTQIEFNAEESKVHGYTGCNIMNGAYTQNGKELSFGERMATTMMAGPEENMKAERDILDALTKVESVKSSGENLQLLDADKNIVIELGK